MSGIVKFPDGSSLGIHALAYLAMNRDRPIPQNEIAESFSISEAHLAKVMQTLRRTGFVSATRGPAGGYELAKEPSAITLLMIHEALQGPAQPVRCLLGEPVCKNKGCPLGKFFHTTESILIDYLRTTTLEAVVKFLI